MTKKNDADSAVAKEPPRTPLEFLEDVMAEIARQKALLNSDPGDESGPQE